MYTLGEFEKHVLFHHLDLSAMPCKVFGELAGEQRAKPRVRADVVALTFYLLNHFVADIRKGVHHDQPLTSVHKEWLDAYVNYASDEALRMLVYIVLICVRESRHLKWNDEVKAGMTEKFSKDVKKFIGSVPDNPHEAVSRFSNDPPDISMGELTAALVYVFEKGTWTSGYGGKAWAHVAQCVDDFIHGRSTAEVMLDTSFTLAHNNGPIFNKGMLFDGYSAQFLHLLDVQRSGQIPELCKDQCLSLGVDWKYAKKMVSKFEEDFDAPFGQYVDWYKVQMLGSVTHCGGMQKQQVQKWGPSPYMSVAQEIKAIQEQQQTAKSAKALQALKKKQEREAKQFARKMYEYMPNHYLEKVKLVRDVEEAA